MARLSEHGIRLSSMSPSFLNSNSTSHTRPFSAVAELIDNASDPGVSAKKIWVDLVHEADQPCLTFTDNGSGMTPNKLHKMLSFGFTEKGSGKASQLAIGVYGNGFKSGSMRLGRDALIFTKNGGCQTVGLLSQTYLANIKAQAVIVPIVPFNQQTKSLVVTEDSQASLSAILQHSIINSLEQIHEHFDSISSKKGTKILIWNIRRAKDGKPEMDFGTDASDFRLPEIQIEELKKGLKNSGSLKTEQNIPEMYYSLRAYLSILYLKPRTQIILRGKKVVAKLMSKKLTYIEHDVYKPQFSKEKVRVTFGFNAKNREHYGIMMYHKNRLIKAYEKVGWQLKASGQRAGTGVIGIIECNFLKPAHNKQDFEYTKEYRLTLGALGLKLNDYWKEVTDKRAKEREFQALDRDEDQDGVDEGPMWLQCEECLKWRSIPAGHYKVAPESWNCSQNPNARYRTCSSPEEGEEEVLLTPTYQKNHKKPEHVKNKKRERSSEFKEKAAKHEVSLQRSSEPVKPTSRWSPEHTTTKDQHRDVEETFEHDTNTDHLAGYQGKDNSSTQSRTKESSTGRNTIIKNKNEVPPGQSVTEDETSNLDLQDEDCDQRTNILSLKRKNQSLISCDKKKRLLSEEQQPESGNKTEETQPGKQKNIFKSLSTKDNKNDSSSRVDNLDTNAQQAHTGHTWSHPVPFTQTVVVSPLSWTEGPQSRTLPPEGGSREATMQRLAGLEKEAERLRSLLGLEIAKTTQDAVTVTDNSLEKPKKRQVNSSNCKETSCQTDIAECSASSSGPTGVAQSLGLAFQGQKALSEANSQPELSRTRKERTESQSKMRVGDTETEDRRSVQDSLRGIRSNVVALLTALLPQLDLTGISLETADVDNILQQIIEVNSLKL